MSAPKIILELIDRFDRNLEAYKSGKYNETQLRREFIDPFFEALGWDVHNKQGYAEAYKDVIHEDSIKVGVGTKAPDYCFRVGGARKFFVEAKKPSVNVKKEISPAYQVRRYAWSSKLPLSILTDFEEFSVYDCRTRPLKTNKASAARVLYITYKEYAERWDEIASIFSHEAILKGSFDKYIKSTRKKRGTAEVDNAFLKEIESWRMTLAKNIAEKNKKLTRRELNFAVQRTIDRIIFLRICEDRGIENYGQLMALQNGGQVYTRLCDLFGKADDKYNSGLFHFNEERGRVGEPDNLSLNLKIDDDVLKKIVKHLYYPDSPYEFSVLPADILGQVYEQFLGKVISLTSSHKAKIEEKPEVRKAGGVYYTPTYIVDYIVKNTVGKLVEGKTPKQAAKLKILDPACGSGSFLIGAFQYLIDWHRDWYEKDGVKKWATKKSPVLFQDSTGEWKLTTSAKRQILLNNIHGVDIDSQAVEVTKLSLLLKVLEGETEQTINSTLRLFNERALPDLGNNIKCGNSLIGPDFYDNEQMSMLDEEERYRINVFDWQTEFPKIMKTGGFDAVIGNPPYVDIKGLPPLDVQYIFSKYPLSNNRVNMFAAFIEKILSIVKSGCFCFSMIVPTALISQESYKSLRCHVVDNYHVEKLVRLPNESFGARTGDVKVDTVIFVFQNKQPKKNLVEIIGYGGYDRISEIDPKCAQVHDQIDQSLWSNSNDCVWSVNTREIDNIILRRCERNSVFLEKCVDFSLGLTPYDKYKGHTKDQIRNKVFHATFRKDKNFKKLLAGNDVCRYLIKWNGKQWIKYGPWLGAPREQKFFTEKRILVKQIIDWTTKRIWATITDEELYNTQNAFNLLPKPKWKHEYLLGIVNSRLMTYYHRKKFLDEFKMRFQKILIKDCKRFPVRAIDFSIATEKKHHDQIVDLVDSMLELNQQLTKSKTAHEKTSLQRQIDATDNQIDKLVYELYGLTEEEVGVVEESR